MTLPRTWTETPNSRSIAFASPLTASRTIWSRSWSSNVSLRDVGKWIRCESFGGRREDVIVSCDLGPAKGPVSPNQHPDGQSDAQSKALADAGSDRGSHVSESESAVGVAVGSVRLGTLREGLLGLR